MQDLLAVSKAQLSDTASLWNEKLIAGDLSPENGLDLSLPNRCLVAEAHKFKDYDCDQCDLHGTLIFFSSVISESENVNDLKYTITPKVYEKINDFMDHWNKAHN
jgi:hypothetical protein